MSDYRYEDKERRFDEELEGDLAQLASEKAASKSEAAPAESGLDRIAKKKTPLDEVKAIIDASRNSKTAEDLVKERRVKEKLAHIRNRGPRLIEDFLKSDG